MCVRYYTETVIQIFKTYTETRIRCYIDIISRILADSYRVNKRDKGYMYSYIPYKMINGKVIQEIYSKILLCIQPFTAQMQENTMPKIPVFTVVLCSVDMHMNLQKFWSLFLNY